jgi:CheY-like chemotaxis protein
VDSVLALQSYVLSRNRLTADVDIPDDLPALLVDRGQIQQVLVNLTFNSAQAIRSAGRPGTIRIEARPVAERAGDGDGDGEVRKVRIAVVDDGPGVPAEILDRLFMPFATTKPPGEGTGLGLSVSFGIVTGHGGTLRHEPNPSGGATFVVELPVEPGAGAVRTATRLPSSAGAAAPPDEAAGAPPRILVLDDEPSIREFLARTLVRYGYEPVLAGDGPAALEIVRSDPPAAILCDHRMAGMSGTEFHAAVGAIAPELSRRFAFMSGDVLNPELREFAAARGVHLLAKPFDLSTVQMVVGALLEERD